MLFFHRKKRQFACRSQRRVFVTLFLFMFLTATIISLISKVNAETSPVASVDFFSQNSDFNNVDPGAWKVTKSAEWIDIGKARITFDVTSRNIVDNNPKDIILVTENSYSMEGWKIDSVKYDASLFVDDILDGTDNAIAVITFNERATILSDFSNDAQALKSKINSITTRDCTSFYRALLKLEELLDSHTFQ